MNGSCLPKPGPPHLAGSLRVARALTLQAARWPAPISVPAGGRIDLDGQALTVTALSVVTPGLRGGVAGRATLDTDDLARTRLALTLAAELDAAHFPVRLPDGVVASGGASVDARIGGTLGGDPGPMLDGGARLQNLTVQLGAATPAARANGRVDAHGDQLRTDGLRVDIAGVGAVTIGAPGTPEYASEFRRWVDQWTAAAKKAGAESIRIGLDPGSGGGAGCSDGATRYPADVCGAV